LFHVDYEGSVGLSINANAIFLEVGLTATVGFVATADIFDPFPDTSGGLVRPYELIVYQGVNPINWFEFTLSMYFELEMYLRVQIWFFFDTIVVYELSYSIREELIEPIVITPPAVTAIAEVLDGELQLSAGAIVDAAALGLECVSQDGTLGDETIECSIGQKFATGEGVSLLLLSAGSSSPPNMAFAAIQSPIVLGNVGSLTLDYSSSGSTILSTGAIAIGATSIQAGIASVQFVGVNGASLSLPFPEVQDLTTTLSDCNHAYSLEGHTNIIIEADKILDGCSITATGGENVASVLVDFGTGACEDGNTVTVSTDDGETTVELYRVKDPLTKTFRFGPAFQVFEFQMSNCNDAASVLKTLSTTLSVRVNGGEGKSARFAILSFSSIKETQRFLSNVPGDDSVTIGDAVSGVNEVKSNVDVVGGMFLASMARKVPSESSIRA
jgi:hypothetical protein